MSRTGRWMTHAMLILIGILGLHAKAQAQSTEERFQDLFKTAGYSTAFGAAMGAAFLAFTDDPASRLKYVAVGASLGFIGGSLFGSYIIFSPMFADSESNPIDQLLADTALRVRKGPEPRIAIKPIIDLGEQRLAGVGGAMTLLRF